jgi:hypothetical protein
MRPTTTLVLQPRHNTRAGSDAFEGDKATGRCTIAAILDRVSDGDVKIEGESILATVGGLVFMADSGGRFVLLALSKRFTIEL